MEEMSAEGWREKFRARRVVEMARHMSVGDGLGAALEWLDPMETEFRELELAEMGRAASISGRPTSEEALGSTLRVMTWNIKFGGGRVDFWFDGHGDRAVLNGQEVLEAMEGVAAAIEALDPDILLLQEVDRRSRRVDGMDQFQWLLDHTPMNYGAYASQWRCRWVPTRGLGAVDMGVAILSKTPIVDARRIALPQIEDEARITRYFYLKRGMLSARVQSGDRRGVRVVNIHTEPFARDRTKWRQLRAFRWEMERLRQSGEPWIAGGDLNAIPPGSEKVHRFEDQARTPPGFEGSDFRGEEDWLAPFYERYEPAVSLAAYRRDNGPYLTHSSTGDVFWCRKLDYLWTDRRFGWDEVQTHQGELARGLRAMELSDHAPVSAMWSWE